MGNEQKKMEVFGFLKDEEINNRTVCTSFLPHRSSRVLRGKDVVLRIFITIGAHSQYIVQESLGN